MIGEGSRSPSLGRGFDPRARSSSPSPLATSRVQATVPARQSAIRPHWPPAFSRLSTAILHAGSAFADTLIDPLIRTDPPICHTDLETCNGTLVTRIGGRCVPSHVTTPSIHASGPILIDPNPNSFLFSIVVPRDGYPMPSRPSVWNAAQFWERSTAYQSEVESRHGRLIVVEPGGWNTFHCWTKRRHMI
jgi:hypothetical protein